MTWRVIVGTLALIVTMIVLGYVAVTEQDRMAQFSTAYAGRQVETGAALFENNCARCHGLDGKGTGRAPALNTPDLLTNGKRLTEIGWGGSVRDYVHSTIAGGRPRPSVQFAEYPERMPTWSQEFGGPLRDDQIQSITDFVMNWAPQYANATAEPSVAITPVGTDITQALPTGDAAQGEALATTLGCPACHILGAGATTTLGPDWKPSAENNNQGIGTRAEARITAPDYKGAATNGTQYLFESIVSPDAYIVPGGATYVGPDGKSIMPHDFGTRMSPEMMAHVLAYLQTLK
ncbi:MAG TPA: c-type cytochrome [Chloroflexia bacterium]|nr:c-type cytochrome [Chloroflexia bacterium]